MSGTYDRDNKKWKLNPVVSFNFALEVEAMFFMPLRSVRVFTKENEFEYYQEGGINDYVHMLRKPISKPFTFQVERYVGMSASTDLPTSFFDPIALGTDLILPVVLYVTHYSAGTSGSNFNPLNTPRVYIFTGCTVTAKEYGELNAERSGLATETTTIAYKEVFVMNTLWTGWEAKKKMDIDNLSKPYKPQDAVRWSSTDTTATPVLFDIDSLKKPYKPNDRIKWSSSDTTAEPVLWDIDSAKSPYKPKDGIHWSSTDTKATPEKIDLDAVSKSGVRPYAPQPRIKWSNTDTTSPPEKIDLDAVAESGIRPYKPQDRIRWSDSDTVAEPSIWPPTRRALMANELAK